MKMDFIEYLPNNILVKLDRASMLFSLETRCPFLSKDLIEFANELNNDDLFYNNSGKLIVRKCLSKILPTKLFNRPKMGFGIPLSEWLRGPLHEYVNDTLSKTNINRKQILNYDTVQAVLKKHAEKKVNAQNLIWHFLQLQSWADKHLT